MAIGTDANPLLTKETPGLNLSKEGYIEVDENNQTSLPWVYAGGDITTGSVTVISAMEQEEKPLQVFINIFKRKIILKKKRMDLIFL